MLLRRGRVDLPAAERGRVRSSNRRPGPPVAAPGPSRGPARRGAERDRRRKIRGKPGSTPGCDAPYARTRCTRCSAPAAAISAHDGVAKDLLGELRADLAALQGDGLSDARRAEIYETLLALGALGDDERLAAAERAIADADGSGDPLLRIVSRLIGLSHIPDEQRALAHELTQMLDT